MRREHLRPQQRSHYVISDGGDQPNVVPSEAKIWFYLREMDFAAIEKMLTTADTIADGAAKMTSTTVSRRILGVAATKTFKRPTAAAATAKIVAGSSPPWAPHAQILWRTVHDNAGASAR